MQIRVKLMGLLKSKQPPEGRLELPDKSTIEAALQALDIPAEYVQVVMVNDQHERDRSRPLVENDALTVLAPVGGG